MTKVGQESLPGSEEHRRRWRESTRRLRAEKKRRIAAIAALETLKPTFCDAADVYMIFVESCRIPAQPAWRSPDSE